MGRASMRKWVMRDLRARETDPARLAAFRRWWINLRRDPRLRAIRPKRGGAVAFYWNALHMRLRERKRRRFWANVARVWGPDKAERWEEREPEVLMLLGRAGLEEEYLLA